MPAAFLRMSAQSCKPMLMVLKARLAGPSEALVHEWTSASCMCSGFLSFVLLQA